MNKEFVPYQESLILKEMGFNEECLGFYEIVKPNDEDISYERNGKFHLITGIKNHNIISGVVAPLFQQAFRWFRTEYGLFNKMDQHCGKLFYVNIEEMNHPCIYNAMARKEYGEYKSYEEVELASLRKLIEIVKTDSRRPV